jgi:hypothetical protein
MSVTRYRAAVEVQAVRWDGGNLDHVRDLLDGLSHITAVVGERLEVTLGPLAMTVEPGDWLARTDVAVFPVAAADWANARFAPIPEEDQ